MLVSPCLVLSLLFTMAHSYSSSRHSSPTCEQLREFWDEMGEMAQAAEITNEIPILPLRVQNAIDRMTFKNNQRGKPYKKMLKDKSPYFLDTTNPSLRYSIPEPFLPPIPNHFFLSKQQAPLKEELIGEFHREAADDQSIGSFKQQATKDRHYTNPEALQSESSLPGNRRNDEVEYFIPEWGLPEDVDTFGSFVDFTSPYLPMTRTPKGQWSDIQHEQSHQTCDSVINLSCRTNEGCFCKGLKKLSCIQGKCLDHGNDEDIAGKYGVWHEKPIPHSQLQLLARRQKRSYKSIFM